jgi:hypothetical protein
MAQNNENRFVFCSEVSLTALEISQFLINE